MPRLTKIYTRTGDTGTTALGSRQRVPKDNLRVQAYGTVDELNSMIGMALAFGLDSLSAQILAPVQHELFNLGAELAFPPEEGKTTTIPQIEDHHISKLEEWIDKINPQLGQLKNFVLPGGSRGAASLHQARTVCRRAEREVVSLSQEEAVREQGLRYLNRLSDLLFVLARFENHQQGTDEVLWDSHS